jgi:hypothetical protein
MTHKLHNKWVTVRSKERTHHDEFILVRLLDIERVAVRQVTGGGSNWQVWVTVKNDEFKFDESKIKQESAKDTALKLLDDIAAAS